MLPPESGTEPSLVGAQAPPSSCSMASITTSVTSWIRKLVLGGGAVEALTLPALSAAAAARTRSDLGLVATTARLLSSTKQKLKSPYSSMAPDSSSGSKLEALPASPTFTIKNGMFMLLGQHQGCLSSGC